MGPVQARIKDKLQAAFAPTRLDIVDDSAAHAHHAGAKLHAAKNGGAAPGIGETHFTVRIASPVFAGMSRVARSRAVHAALAEELAGPVHALALSVEAG
jgi:BolA family transcriptional regulator, general stress-responsive regulator